MVLLMAASSLNLRSEPEDMQIDAVHVKTLIPEERKRRMEEGLCLYCGEETTKLAVAPKSRIDVLLEPEVRLFRKTRKPSHNRNRAAGQSYATTTIRFLSFRPSCPLFYNSFVFWPSETRILSTVRFGGIGLFLRRGLC